MKPLGEKSFVHYNKLNFTNNLFSKLFGKDIKLLSHDTSDGGMGYFILKYQYIPGNYTIVFEHDRLYFSLFLYNENGAFTAVDLISDEKISTELYDYNISAAVSILCTALKNTVPVFYRGRTKKGRLIIDEEE